MRHLIDHIHDPVDTDGCLHLAKVAWRAMANLEKYLESVNADNSGSADKLSSLEQWKRDVL